MDKLVESNCPLRRCKTKRGCVCVAVSGKLPVPELGKKAATSLIQIEPAEPPPQPQQSYQIDAGTAVERKAALRKTLHSKGTFKPMQHSHPAETEPLFQFESRHDLSRGFASNSLPSPKDTHALAYKIAPSSSSAFAVESSVPFLLSLKRLSICPRISPFSGDA